MELAWEDYDVVQSRFCQKWALFFKHFFTPLLPRHLYDFRQAIDLGPQCPHQEHEDNNPLINDLLSSIRTFAWVPSMRLALLR